MSLSGEQSQGLTAPPGGRIAIIGMSCLFPGAAGLSSYWMNIVGGVDCLREVPSRQWSAEQFYDPDSDRFDSIYCKRGGFIDELAEFDPLSYGVMPSAVNGADPDQFLALKVAVEAFKDAGYLDREFNRDRAEVLLGRTSAPGAGSLNLIQHGQTIGQVLDILAAQNPQLDAEQLEKIARKLKASLPPCNADTIPGVMPNVLAGRIANRLGLRGKNLILDGACASSLLAVDLAMRDLLSGESDLALAGGVHVNSNAFFYQMFCRLGALSRSQQIRPFDASADGTILGEGIGMVVLKRLEDAIEDGDRIYAVILGSGTSSNGHDTSTLAPSVEGEALAMQKAYEMAGISPASIGLLEAHGTGTPAGDLAELKAMQKVFGPSTAPWCAIGSVKSMIGHTQAASGIAGLIKAALALYHKVLPPTLNVKHPTPAIDWHDFPGYVNVDSRPWSHPSFGLAGLSPRRAAVSAFGFGGINVHLALEEYGCREGVPKLSLQQNWDTELLALGAETPQQLQDSLASLINYLMLTPDLSLRDLSYTFSCRGNHDGSVRLAVLASSIDDLLNKLKKVDVHIGQNPLCALVDEAAIYYSPQSCRSGKLAYLLPGLGAAYPNMLKELCLHFPEVREIFDFVDDLALSAGEVLAPSRMIFPTDRLANSNDISTAVLASMNSAVVTVLMAEYALFVLLNQFKIKPDILLGCSTGEFAAITMSGAVDIVKAASMFYKLSTSVARSVSREQLLKLCSIKVDGSYQELREVLEQVPEPVYLTADLTPSQFILSGQRPAIDAVGAALKQRGVEYHYLPLAIPYHTPLVQGAVSLSQDEVQQLPISVPDIESWSCSTTECYPNDVEVIRRITTELFTKPILFKSTIEALYEQGVRTFVEIGPRGGLTGLVEDILSGREFLALACDLPKCPAITHLQTVLSRLWTAGVSLEFDYLFQRRGAQILNLQLLAEQKPKPVPARLSLGYPELKLTHAVAPRQLSPDLALQAGDDFEGNNLSHSDQHQQPAAGADVLQGYLAALGQFHAQISRSQEAVMLAYLQSVGGAGQDDMAAADNLVDGHKEAVEGVPGTEHWLPAAFSGAAGEELPSGDYALLQAAVIRKQEEGVDVHRTLDLSQDLFLLDHAIGGPVRLSAGKHLRVYLLPLMVALELMAEAASILYPKLPVAAIRNVRAYRRIDVNESGFPIRVQVRPAGPGQARVTMLSAGDPGEPVLASCEVEFGPLPAKPAVAAAAELTWQRQPLISPPELYEPGRMFHGPSMQSMLAIDCVGEKAIMGRVQVKPAVDWFAGQSQPRFIIDPLLLDNASQMVLFYLFEQAQPVIALLPFYIESIEFQQELSALSGVACVQANLVSVTDRGTEAWLQIVDESGRIAATICGINSRRISVGEIWERFVNSPVDVRVSQALELPWAELGGPEQWQGAAVRAVDLPVDDGVLDWLADYILSDNEREYWSGKGKNDKRRKEWLLGRIAAKDAIRGLIEKQCPVRLCPADIEIVQNADGKPQVTGNWLGAVGWTPEVSIAHSSGVAAAVSGLPGHCPGVDLEMVSPKDKDFESLAFQRKELQLLEKVAADKRPLALTQMWCAKEALGKAIGSGLSAGLTNLEVEDANWSGGRLVVRCKHPENPGRLAVFCTTFDDLVLAVTACNQKQNTIA